MGWMALEKVQRSADLAFPLYVFYDPTQNIYISQPTLPSNLAGPFVLPTNCRNTRLIARMCGKIIHETIDVHEEAPNGSAPKVVVAVSAPKVVVAVSAPKVVVAVSDADVVKRARDQVQEWCLRERGNLA